MHFYASFTIGMSHSKKKNYMKCSGTVLTVEVNLGDFTSQEYIECSNPSAWLPLHLLRFSFILSATLACLVSQEADSEIKVSELGGGGWLLGSTLSAREGKEPGLGRMFSTFYYIYDYFILGCCYK